MMRNLKSQRGNTPNSDEIKHFQNENCNIILYMQDLLTDVYNNLPRTKLMVAAKAKDEVELVKRFKSEGLSFVTMTLPKLSAGLFQYLETRQVCYPSFEIKKGTVHPVFLSGLFRLACDFSSLLQVRAIRSIYQFSVFFSKLKGPYPDSVLRKQLADFVADDRRLDSVDFFAEPVFSIMQQARYEMNLLFHNNNVIERACPRPGPGATNKPVAKHKRYKPLVLYRNVDKVLPYIDWFLVNPYDVVHQTAHYLKLYSNARMDQRARHKFVHKKVGKARGICIEENEVQFLQQAFRRSIYDYVEQHPLTKGRVCFRNQSVNQQLALLFSWTGQGATIDWSAASDLVGRDPVSWIFQDIDFHDILMSLSTKWIDFPDFGKDTPPLHTSKFAPMGSALCFPIMALFFWALIRAVIHLSMYKNALKEEVYVYGDDVIIPSCITEAVYTYLPMLGLRVNKEKSYFRSGFRESCGVHAYNGVDITPVYAKYIPTNNTISSALSCIATEYQLHNLGLSSTALRYRKQLYELFGVLPTVPVTSGIFGITRDGNFFPQWIKRVKKKRDAWGNPTYRFRTVRLKTKSFRPPTEEECYLRHVLTKDIEQEVGGTPKLTDFELAWKYVPVPVCYGYYNKFTINEERCERDIKQELTYYANLSE